MQTFVSNLNHIIRRNFYFGIGIIYTKHSTNTSWGKYTITAADILRRWLNNYTIESPRELWVSTNFSAQQNYLSEWLLSPSVFKMFRIFEHQMSVFRFKTNWTLKFIAWTGYPSYKAFHTRATAASAAPLWPLNSMRLDSAAQRRVYKHDWTRTVCYCLC